MSTGMYLLMLGSAVLPSAILLGLFYVRDKFPEPFAIVFKTFLLGVLAVGPIWGYIELHYYLFGDLSLDPYLKGLYRAFTLAALPEELCKYAIFMIYVRRQSAFDEPMDGLVYGAAASLGFATLENMIYVDAGGWAVALTRATTAVPLHAMLGAIMGDYIAHAKFDHGRKFVFYAKGFLYPLILHGMYNAPLLVMESHPNYLTEMEIQLYIAFVYMILISMIIQVVWVNYRLRQLQQQQAARLAELEARGSA